jgi:hypothetical protein
MNWYKRAKSLQDIAWDPSPEEGGDDYKKTHLGSDISAILEQIYPKPPDSIDIASEVDSSITQLIEYGGERSMWDYFVKKENHEPNSEQAIYFQSIREKSEKYYEEYYKKRKGQDEGQINIEPEQAGGAPPPPM